MVVNGQLDSIQSAIRERRLAQALTNLENYLLTYAHPQESEQLRSIRDDYHLMTDYWQRGFRDSQRHKLYQSLLQRMQMLTTNLTINEYIRQAPFVLNAYKRCRAARQNWSLVALRQELENYVAELALLELKPEHTRRTEERLLCEQHQRLLSSLFDYVWTSHTWSERTADAFTDLLLSPTIDSNDQRLLVSAVTLSLLNIFDFHKLRVLMNVYSRSADEQVRQRALVGWTLGLDSRQMAVWPEMLIMLKQLTDDDRCRQELKELQMQFIYCLKADEDSQKIQQEMIPEIIKNNDQFRITRNGLEEIEEDAMEDILHPELSEQRMENLEATMRKMIDMQRAGSDIYFGGFSQMKRFPFFNDTSNWLMPFNTKHPALSEVMADERNKRILVGLLSRSPFCDSDAYSFTLGFHQATNQLPKHMLDLLDRGELSVIGEQMFGEDMQQPAFLRRKYLQDVYRFFRLFPSRSVFNNPFNIITGSGRLFFFCESCFCETPLVSDFVEVAAFLAKQRYQRAALRVLKNCPEQVHGERYYLTLATLSAAEATDCYQKVLAQNPQQPQALRGLARTHFAEQDYQGALDAYEQLLSLHPNHHNYLLNKAVCLANLQQYDKAQKILFKMNYEMPDNQNIKRVLAWILVGSGKLEQATSLYEQLLETPRPDDYLNSGFCKWICGQIVEAVELFRKYADACGSNGFNAEMEFRRERELLQRNGIGDVEIRLMIDMLTA